MNGGRAVRVDGDDVLSRNHAAREWAAGLREWSRSAREASSAQRERARGHGAPRPGPPRTARPRPALGARDGAPSLGEVPVVELRSLLVERHRFAESEAETALALAMLVAGYPEGHSQVSGVDALDVVEHALRHRL